MKTTKRINSRQKGKRIEREACKFLERIGFPGFQRTAQNCGKSGDAADVRPTDPDHPLAHIHFEVKGDESIDVGTTALYNACIQAKDDSMGRSWVVLWRRKGGTWRVTVRDPGVEKYIVPVTYGGVDVKDMLERWAK